MNQPLAAADAAKFAAAKRASELVETGMKVGLGTGSTAAWLVRALAARQHEEGLRFQAVPTSTQTAALAGALGIPLTTLDAAGWLDLTIDGADEVDAQFSLIKGGGGALLQEKIVAKASDRMVVIADSEKQVAQLGKFALPVEVIGFGKSASETLIKAVLEDLGFVNPVSKFRPGQAGLFVTDEGNHILDIELQTISNPAALAQALNQVPGVVENGLFIDICSALVIGHSDGRVSYTDVATGTEEAGQIDLNQAARLAEMGR